MIFAEPVQNAGGCLMPPAGYWQGLRELADRYGILLVADEVITGFGRLGEWFGVDPLRRRARHDHDRQGPDLGLRADGRRARLRARSPRRSTRSGATLLHGITFGGHPRRAAIALRNLEIFERERVLENVRELEAHLRARMEELLRAADRRRRPRRRLLLGRRAGAGRRRRALRRRRARAAAARLPARPAARGRADRPRRRPRRRRWSRSRRR